MTNTPSNDFHEHIENLLATIIQEFMHYMKSQGLSMQQVHALMYIYHNGECQVSDIRDLGQVTNAAASQMTDRLVQAGWVEREEAPTDRRVKLLRLSGKGRELIRASILSNQSLRNLLDGLTEKQKATLHEALQILSQSFGKNHMELRTLFNETKEG